MMHYQAGPHSQPAFLLTTHIISLVVTVFSGKQAVTGFGSSQTGGAFKIAEYSTCLPCSPHAFSWLAHGLDPSEHERGGTREWLARNCPWYVPFSGAVCRCCSTMVALTARMSLPGVTSVGYVLSGSALTQDLSLCGEGGREVKGSWTVG